MNIIFITLSNINGIKVRGIYADLMRKFRNEGHDVYIVSAAERRTGMKTHLMDVDGVHILKVRTLNVQKTNVVEKGIGQLMMEGQYKHAIKKHLGDVKFDLVLYSTPPITFTNVVRYLKKRNPQAVSYLLLKDIFPQNAVDIGMFGEKSLFNWYFRRKEVALYKASDFIGCMSPANVEFILKHNSFIDASKVEVAPNSIELRDESLELSDSSDGRNKRLVESKYIRSKYSLPKDTPIFIYGGNLGKPQGIDYLIQCLEANKERKDCHFVVVGNGTEYGKLKAWFDSCKSRIGESENGKQGFLITLMQRLPKEDYDMLVRSCDVGMIFLDHRFTIPNYPSRLLPYLEYKMPVICCTDQNTDIGRIAEENGYGFWCESVRPEDFTALVDKVLKADRKEMGERGYEFLKKNYTVQNTYDAIMGHLKG